MNTLISDRELLELAAKAAGVPVHELYDTIGDNGGVEKEGWNPLTDDGDALRLAVKLELTISLGVSLSREPRCRAFLDDRVGASEPAGADPLAATRRAIVRAAAEIGRAMP